MAINPDELKGTRPTFDRAAQAGAVFIAPRDGLSHVSGERLVPLLDKTIPQLLGDTVRAHGPRDAAVFPSQGKRFSWDELAQTVDTFAAGLAKLGLGKGERVGIWSPNR